MGLIRISTCCGPRLLDNNYFFAQSEALEEAVFTAAVHGLGKIPSVTVYDLEGHEFEPEVQVDEETFEITVRQEAPAIAFLIAMN
jgi:hypothetical protein